MRRKSERHEQDSNSPLNPFYLSINNMSKKKEWKWNCGKQHDEINLERS